MRDENGRFLKGNLPWSKGRHESRPQRRTGKIVHCLFCGTPKYKPLNRLKTTKHHYCNTSCQNRFEKSIGVNKTLKAHQSVKLNGQPKRLGKPATWVNSPKSDHVRRKISQAKLKNNWMRGRRKSASPSYRGGKILYRGWNWKEVRLKAKTRDGFQCVRCRKSEDENIQECGQPLQVDHIVPYRLTKDNCLENLQTLCNKCHGKKIGEEYWQYRDQLSQVV